MYVYSRIVGLCSFDEKRNTFVSARNTKPRFVETWCPENAARFLHSPRYFPMFLFQIAYGTAALRHTVKHAHLPFCESFVSSGFTHSLSVFNKLIRHFCFVFRTLRFERSGDCGPLTVS